MPRRVGHQSPKNFASLRSALERHPCLRHEETFPLLASGLQQSVSVLKLWKGVTGEPSHLRAVSTRLHEGPKPPAWQAGPGYKSSDYR